MTKPSFYIVPECEGPILRYRREVVNQAVPVAQWPFKETKKKPGDVVISNVGDCLRHRAGRATPRACSLGHPATIAIAGER